MKFSAIVSLFAVAVAAQKSIEQIVSEHQERFRLAKRDVIPSNDSDESVSAFAASIQDRYIILFEQGASLQTREEHYNKVDVMISAQGAISNVFGALADIGNKITQGIEGTYAFGTSKEGSESLYGYYGKFSADTVEQIKNTKGVKVVEKDSVESIAAPAVQFHDIPEEQTISKRQSSPTYYLKRNATWGISRISQRNNPEGTNTEGFYYFRGATTGAAPLVYVIDTGVRTTHKQFYGRATFGANFIDDVDTDENGHGTHVAGTIGAYDYDFDKNRNGSLSGFLSGLSWAIDHHLKNPSQRAIINYSGSGAVSQARDAAVARAIAAGLPVVAAAGNAAGNACDVGPANNANVTGFISVAASDEEDAIAGFSNFGKCVNVFAPGVDILSLSYQSDTGLATMSGTSMATPHVSGIMSYWLTLNLAMTPAQMAVRLTENATPIKIKGNQPDTVNLLANNLVFDSKSP
ncbi:Aqualysin-1 [Yarrowia sp. C11]|nr:Aqualysin-1 [Yarrowia sp. C11]